MNDEPRPLGSLEEYVKYLEESVRRQSRRIGIMAMVVTSWIAATGAWVVHDALPQRDPRAYTITELAYTQSVAREEARKVVDTFKASLVEIANAEVKALEHDAHRSHDPHTHEPDVEGPPVLEDKGRLATPAPKTTVLPPILPSPH